jgi:energy-coupling factor transporter ATP-binding protein EcfA2
MEMITFDRVRFGYAGQPVLRDVSFAVRAGEGVGLFGANGAGKTTALRLTMALLHPDAGSIAVGGKRTAGLGPEDLAGKVGYLFQRPEDQLIRTTVREELAYCAERLGWEAARIATAVEEALEECQLDGVAALHPYDLPLPKRRLVALASLLVTDPEVLLLDEPTALLDRAGRVLVAEIVRTRVAAGRCVIAVTHDPAFAIEALDRGIALAQGGVAEDASVERLLRSGVTGMELPPSVVAAERSGVAAKSLRMADLAAALAHPGR